MDLYKSLFGWLYWIFGFAMNFLLDLFNNKYFVALIIFVILTRIITLPFTIKQQKTAGKSGRIQPKIAKIQKKYANTGNQSQKQMAENRQKMNEEMQALYARENHNPMNMGCGPMIFSMVFLMGIIGIIYYPMEYVLRIPKEAIDTLAAAIDQLKNASASSYSVELSILSNFDALRPLVESKVDASLLDQIAAYRSGLVIGNFDLTQTPAFKLEPLVLIPLFSFISSMLSSIYSQLAQRKNNPAMADQNKQMMWMMLLMPFMSLFIAFRVPAGVGIYWIISNVVQIIQQVGMNQFYSPKKVQARSMIDGTIERRSKEENTKKIKSTT